MENELKEIIPFKGGRPKNPLIVGLVWSVLPDDVNNLISKYVGVKNRAFENLLPWELRLFRTEDMVKNIMKKKFLRIYRWCSLEYGRLLKIKSIPNRRLEFAKLPKWVRKEIILIIADNINDLFPTNKKNIHFINEQMIELNIDELP
jgi:hypothetical protein